MPSSIRTAYQALLTAEVTSHTSGRDYWTAAPPKPTVPYTVTEIVATEPVGHYLDKSGLIKYTFRTHLFFNNALDAHSATQAVLSSFTRRYSTTAEESTYDQVFEFYVLDAVENPLDPVDGTGLPLYHWIVTLNCWAQQE